MHVLTTRNVNTAVANALPYLLTEGIVETSRNGKVLVAPGPVCTVYTNPKEHVLFSPTRDANPVFHLLEALWMIAGRNDVAYPAQFNKKFVNYSDDGIHGFGAYGWRWRKFFGYDQLRSIITDLKENPNSRRAVLSMWNAHAAGVADGTGKEVAFGEMDDLLVAASGGRDVPCNVSAAFDCRGGVLNMTVFCRSNDAVFGCYGANACHFAVLLEYMAEQIGVPIGVYRQFSNNLHAYLDVHSEKYLKQISDEASITDFYNPPSDDFFATTDAIPIPTIPLGSNTPGWEDRLNDFLNTGTCSRISCPGYEFLSDVAVPMFSAWQAHKEKDTARAQDIIEQNMPYCDWRLAAREWLQRRLNKQQEKKV